MRHIADALLFVVTLWAATVAGGVALFLIGQVWPVAIETISTAQFIYCALVALAGVAAGALLMTHLKWSFRFKLLAILPFLFAVITIVINALPSPSAAAFFYRLGWATMAQLQLLGLALGVLIGASIRKYLA